MTITTRAGKGSALTFSEVDANFTDLSASIVTDGLLVVDNNGTALTGLTANQYNRVNFSHVIKDRNTWYDAITNFRYTPAVSGWFNVKLTVYGPATGAFTDYVTPLAAAYKNNVRVAKGTFDSNNAGTASKGAGGSVLDCVVSMNGSTDYLEFWSYIPPGATSLTGDVTTTFGSIRRIAAL